jgi:hypothetical protein
LQVVAAGSRLGIPVSHTSQQSSADRNLNQEPGVSPHAEQRRWNFSCSGAGHASYKTRPRPKRHSRSPSRTRQSASGLLAWIRCLSWFGPQRKEGARNSLPRPWQPPPTTPSSQMPDLMARYPWARRIGAA